jgi:hypothetical protein
MQLRRYQTSFAHPRSSCRINAGQPVVATTETEQSVPPMVTPGGSKAIHGLTSPVQSRSATIRAPCPVSDGSSWPRT